MFNFLDDNSGLDSNSLLSSKLPPIENTGLEAQTIVDVGGVQDACYVSESEVTVSSSQADHDYYRRSSVVEECVLSDGMSSPSHNETLYEPQIKTESLSPISSNSSVLTEEQSPLAVEIEDIKFNEMDYQNMTTNATDEDLLQSVLNGANLDMDIGE